MKMKGEKKSIHEQWLNACLSAELPAISCDTAAKISAILLVYGNNEDMVYNTTFVEDLKYIQKRFCVEGSQVPNSSYAKSLKHYAKELGASENIPEWASKLFLDRYNIKLR